MEADSPDVRYGALWARLSPHLPRRIGEALRSAYDGTLDLGYADEDRFIRVSWIR